MPRDPFAVNIRTPKVHIPKNPKSVFKEEKKRKPINMSVKREVHKRAGGRCENPKCRKKLPLTGGASCYHHIRDPSISPTAKTVQLLCRNCHAEHGHSYKTVTKKGLMYNEKKKSIARKRVGSKKPKKRKTKTKKKTTRKKTTRRKKEWWEI